MSRLTTYLNNTKDHYELCPKQEDVKAFPYGGQWPRSYTKRLRQLVYQSLVRGRPVKY
ncbi:hypothetical protein KNT80_gp85 [Vibrio phage 1.245.O._10N.261.54.C7]|uniref:Uncharacterized protein n=1 Tax=Vibrio phage 1.245.O._10N.261.54.C7 TaxID=1881236 RepID=A0A2I7RWG2_9CAUD|nr:hypothetical protein KNT80_gp85 [Vibrio phage 1.245.O._10N.261.54.C7]AUR97998.1 hypothetical protein NVP1245O_85 [Vibrio phage 1.245.O._10N.261.54.C7]